MYIAILGHQWQSKILIWIQGSHEKSSGYRGWTPPQMYESSTDICFLLICCKEKVQWQRKSWKTEITERRGRKEAERGRYYILHLQGKWWYKSFILIRQKVICLTVWTLLSMYFTNTSYSSLFCGTNSVLLATAAHISLSYYSHTFSFSYFYRD